MRILFRPAWHAGVALAGLFTGLSFVVALASWGIFSAVQVPFDWAVASIVAVAGGLAGFAGAWRWLDHRFFHVKPGAERWLATIDGPWLSLRGGPATSIVVNWFASTPHGGLVEAWPVDDANSRQTFGNGAGKVHHVVLAGLAPATPHAYRIVEGPLAGKGGTFTTPGPLDEFTPFTLAAIGDTQNGGGRSRPTWAYPRVVESLARDRPGIIVHAGDATDQGNDIASWHEFLTASLPVAGSTPVMIAVGNHDTGTNMLNDPGARKRPDEGANFDYLIGHAYGAPPDEDEITPFRGRFHALRFHGCTIAFVDTQNSKLADPRSPQWAWLDETLAGPAAWRIVVVHRPQLFIERDAATGSFKLGRSRFARYLLPIFEARGVDLVIQGHGHYYACIEHATGDGKVITFITTGGAGNELREATPLLPGLAGVPGFKIQENSTHHVLARVDRDAIHVVARTPGGRVIDERVLSKGLNPPEASVLP